MGSNQSYKAPEGYTPLESVNRNKLHEITLARRESDGSRVILKSSGLNTTNYGEVSKLGHEYDVLKTLHHEGIPRVMELLYDGNSYTLVQEYIDGITLRDMLHKGRISIENAISYAIQIADILHYLHREGIIHKDINSSNIIVTGEGKVYLIDFGISSNLRNEMNETGQMDQIEGSLIYISPEQTGKTAYTVSHSCDFYSLGILLYEMLTGKPPFDSADPLEIIHFHLSRNPALLSTIMSDIPNGLEKVVAKLMEKNPDDRYQSATGLKYDLTEIAEQMKSGKPVHNFKAGSKDSSEQYKQTQKLYGREQEIKTLLGLYKNLEKQGSMLALVAGYSGVGKSALVRHIKYPILQNKGTFISGKFDQFKKDIPYYAFIAAVQEFIQNLLAETEDKISEWKHKIMQVLGPNAGLITEVIPQLSKITGLQEPAIKLQPAEQEGRFNTVMLDFVYLFSSKNSPLVIFLDDLQWADLPSLNLIRRILENPRQENILIIGAYRDNEVDKAHPLMLTIKQIAKHDDLVKTIQLDPLTLETTCQITADSFGMQTEEASELGKTVFEKTKGNAFFIHSFLKSLFEKKLIRKNSHGAWSWDRQEIENLGYTDNVVDLMTEGITNLPVQTKDVLKYASALGNAFELESLSVIMQKSQPDVYNDLKPAIKGGYIISLDKRYRILALNSVHDAFGGNEAMHEKSAEFAFAHDKVQQAAYGLFSESELKHTHLETGRLLLRTRTEEQIREDIFELLNHFSHSYTLLADEDEKNRISELFLTAGRKAKDSTSYSLGVYYLGIAKELLKHSSWISDYQLTFDICFELGECEYLNNNPHKAEMLFTELLGRARTRFEKLNVYYVHSSLYLKEGNTSESLRLGLEAVKLYGIRFPTSKVPIQIAALFTLLRYLFLFSTKYNNTEKLFLPEDCKDEEIIAVNRFLIDLATSAYQQDQNLMMLVIFKIIDKYIRHGYTDASGWGFSGFSVVVLSALKLQKKGFKLWDITIRLHQKTLSPIIRGRLSYTVSCFHDPWRIPFSENNDTILNNIKACVMHGDQIFTAYSVALYFRKSLNAGKNLKDILNESDDQMSLINKSLGGLDFMLSGLQMVKALNGQTQGDNWNDAGYSESETLERLTKEGNRTKLAFFHTYSLMLNCYFGRHRQALDVSKNMVQYTANFLGDQLEVNYAFYTSLSLAYLYDGMDAHEKKQSRREFKKHLNNLKLWSGGCPENYAAQYKLLMAEWAVMSGNDKLVLQTYEQAIQLAAENKYIHLTAIISERAALYCMKNKLMKACMQYMKDARDAYNIWGAHAKSRQLENAFPSILRAGISHSAESSTDYTTSASSIVSLDLSTVLKASQSISSEVKYDELMKKLMTTTIENAGAGRGCLLLVKGNQLCMEAEGVTGHSFVNILPSVPLEQTDNIPKSFINYSWRLQENVVVDDALIDERFASDPYIAENRIRSMMCIPITAQGRINGLLYLENTLLKGVFNKNRLELLKMLSGQIGISLENALLYENLEEKVAERTDEIEKQKIQLQAAMEQSDALLLNILPKQTAEELKTSGTYKARTYPNACVMFCDIVDFTKLGEKLEANILVNELHELFSGIDDIISKYRIEKIKTIGDAYLCASGLSDEDQGNPALEMVKAALDIAAFCKTLNAQKRLENRKTFELRIGIHCGQLVAGIVGKTKYAYDIWGDTVNTASRMESSGESGKINISGSVYERIKDTFNCTHRGKIEAKGKGQYDMYFVEQP